MNKPFDKNLHDKYDLLGRKITMNFLNWRLKDRNNIKIYSNTDIHAIDICVKRNDRPFINVECEICSGWTDFTWPFPTLRIPGRKKKYIAKNNFFVMIQKNGNGLCWIPSKILKRSPVELMNNIYQNSEPFFILKPENLSFFYHVGDVWKNQKKLKKN